MKSHEAATSQSDDSFKDIDKKNSELSSAQRLKYTTSQQAIMGLGQSSELDESIPLSPDNQSLATGSQRIHTQNSFIDTPN